MFGFYRLGGGVPELRVADVKFNLQASRTLYREACERGAAVLTLPELGLTGYTCGDLFFQQKLLDSARDGALELAAATGDTALVFGLPFRYCDAIYNVAALAQGGKIRGLVPKTVLPNYREFYEKRQFTSGRELIGRTATVGGEPVPFGTDLIFDGGAGAMIGVEICEDLWCVKPPSAELALAGAKILLNPSAGTELSTKGTYRRGLVTQQSARLLCAYVLAGAGVHESTTDAVFGGHALIAENGRLLAETKRFARTGSAVFADVDLERLTAARCSESSFNDNPRLGKFRSVVLSPLPSAPDLRFAVNPPLPFVPAPGADRRERCGEIFDIQCAGLAKRMEHTGAKKLVLGVSGGLDSTLALLVAANTCKLLHRPPETVLAIQLPGFGTTERTHRNAETLCRELGVETRVIDIVEAAKQHFADIGHDPAKLDTTYENTQARERTQVLMDLANKFGGLVVGTGDLSEIALGWSTYNGDHMSMYAVNCSIPKTLIRYLIEFVADESPEAERRVLRDIVATPVSPELLPPTADGEIQQKTEDLVGPYELHDFFLYHFLKYGAPPEKLEYLAVAAFGGRYAEATVRHWLSVFLRRFFAQQFKRSCMPDGPKVGTIALSPRGDWWMPSDASAALFTPGVPGGTEKSR